MSVKIADNPDKIRTGYLLNISFEHQRKTDSLIIVMMMMMTMMVQIWLNVGKWPVPVEISVLILGTHNINAKFFFAVFLHMHDEDAKLVPV
jgi:hypothetical protein